MTFLAAAYGQFLNGTALGNNCGVLTAATVLSQSVSNRMNNVTNHMGTTEIDCTDRIGCETPLNLSKVKLKRLVHSNILFICKLWKKFLT